MHAQTISTTTNTEVTPARALAAMLLATNGTKEERRKLDDLFPQAKQAESHRAWKNIAKGVKKLHEQISNGIDKVGDDQGVVGDAYRKANRAAHRDGGATAQLAAHIAIETIAKSFVTDGTYANYAVNPDGIVHIAALVGELQHQSRGLNRALGLGGLAIDQVFFGPKTPARPRQLEENAEFLAAYAAHRAALSAYAVASKRAVEASDALHEAFPVPECLRRPGEAGREGRFYLTETCITELPRISFDEKARLVGDLRAWRSAMNSSELKSAVDLAEDACNAAGRASIEADELLARARPSTIEGLRLQYEAYLANVVLEVDLQERLLPVRAEQLLEALTDGSDDISQPVRFFQTLVKWTSGDEALTDIAPFDPDAWLAEFETIPGHTVTAFGVMFDESLAWGPGRLTDEDFRVTDPGEIAAYWAAREAFDPNGTADHAKFHPTYRTQPIIAGSIRTYEFIYGEGSPRLAEKQALFDRRAAEVAQPPIGAHLWEALAPWQKKLVRRVAKERDEALKAATYSAAADPIAIAAE